MSRGCRAGLRLALLLAPAVAFAQPAPSQQQLRDARQRAQQERAAAEAAAQRTRALAEEEQRLAERRVAMARDLQAAEQRLSDAEEQARAATEAAGKARAQVAARAKALAPLLPAMRRLSLWPAESLLAVPASAEEAVRGLQVLQALSRHITVEIAALRQAEAEAQRQGAEAARQAQQLTSAQAAARDAAAQLDAELEQARQLRQGAAGAESEAAKRAQEAVARADTLEAALARLEREQAAEHRREMREAARRPEAPAAPPATPQGGRTLPVAGTITREFNAATESGPAHGVTFSAPAGARVVSPCGGRAMFAGPFRSYGLLLIVDCGDGYHFVLAGFDRLDAAPGQRLLAGEPVGVLSAAAEGRGRATLYLELRHRGQPVDPRGWFAAKG